MENQKTKTAQESVAEVTAETTAETTSEAIQEQTPRKKVYRDQDFYPYCAIIICICAAIGQLIGKHLLSNPQTGLTAGMIIGIIAAIAYVAMGGKQIDNSPTKPRKKK